MLFLKCLPQIMVMDYGQSQHYPGGTVVSLCKLLTCRNIPHYRQHFFFASLVLSTYPGIKNFQFPEFFFEEGCLRTDRNLNSSMMPETRKGWISLELFVCLFVFCFALFSTF